MATNPTHLENIGDHIFQIGGPLTDHVRIDLRKIRFIDVWQDEEDKNFFKVMIQTEVFAIIVSLKQEGVDAIRQACHQPENSDPEKTDWSLR